MAETSGPWDAYCVFLCKAFILTCPRMILVQAETYSTPVKATVCIRINLCCVSLNKCSLFSNNCNGMAAIKITVTKF